jgi:hypothetical protein
MVFREVRDVQCLVFCVVLLSFIALIVFYFISLAIIGNRPVV